MSLAIFPAAQLPGLTFPVVKTPTWNTLVQKAVSGRTLRVAKQAAPVMRWKVPFDFLKGDATARQLQTLLGFYNQRYGGFDEFLFDDPDDDSVTAQSLGAGDGVTTQFPLLRALGGFVEPIGAVNAITAVKVNGVATAAYSQSAVNGYLGKNAITFTTAPAAGAAVTADFSYYWRVRFADDSYDFEKFVYQIWSQGGIVLEQVR
jgi:uncharacterized protein (TIGR02217 family)